MGAPTIFQQQYGLTGGPSSGAARRLADSAWPTALIALELVVVSTISVPAGRRVWWLYRQVPTGGAVPTRGDVVAQGSPVALTDPRSQFHAHENGPGIDITAIWIALDGVNISDVADVRAAGWG